MPTDPDIEERISALEEQVQELRELVTTLAVVNDLCPVCERGVLDADWDDEVVRCERCGEEFDLSGEAA